MTDSEPLPIDPVEHSPAFRCKDCGIRLCVCHDRMLRPIALSAGCPTCWSGMPQPQDGGKAFLEGSRPPGGKSHYCCHMCGGEVFWGGMQMGWRPCHMGYCGGCNPNGAKEPEPGTIELIEVVAVGYTLRTIVRTVARVLLVPTCWVALSLLVVGFLAACDLAFGPVDDFQTPPRAIDFGRTFGSVLFAASWLADLFFLAWNRGLFRFSRNKESGK